MKDWKRINIHYWTTNATDWERIVNKISNPLKGHSVDDVRVHVGDSLILKTKKWWEFWK